MLKSLVSPHYPAVEPVSIAVHARARGLVAAMPVGLRVASRPCQGRGLYYDFLT